MATFDELIDKAVEDGGLPGVVLMARSRDGKLDYARAAGRRTLEPGNEQPMRLDTVFKLASASKFLTTIAVLQAVEKGLVGWEDDVSAHVPALADQDILTGFTWYGKPLTRPRRNPITIRSLLTQTAGAGYDFLPIQPLWWYKWWHKQPIAKGDYMDERLAYPLLHEPGEGWTYGSGVSWAGKVLEEVSGMTLEAWMRAHIAEPLGLSSLTFFPAADPAVSSRLASLSYRNAWTGRVGFAPELDQPDTAVDCMGGEGVCASAEDTMAILSSLLTDDGRLLGAEATRAMFQPQLSDPQRREMRKCLGLPGWICGSIIKGAEYDWGIGGVLIDGDDHEYLRKGTLMWSGLFHVLWWIDREAGICGMFGTQVLPAADKVVVPLIAAFQREVYDRIDRERREVAWGEKTEAGDQGAVQDDSSWQTQYEKPSYSTSAVHRLSAWASNLWRHV